MSKYTIESERWLRSNAGLYERKGNLQMARNMAMCADELADTEWRLKVALALGNELQAELAALKEAASKVVDEARHGAAHTFADALDALDALAALAALVGEE